MRSVINFRTDELQKEKLEAIAKLTGKNVSDVLREIINDHLETCYYEDVNHFDDAQPQINEDFKGNSSDEDTYLYEEDFEFIADLIEDDVGISSKD